MIHVLKIMGRLPQDEAEIFTREAVLPALKKMSEGFKDGDNPYAKVIATIAKALTVKYAQSNEDQP